MLKIPSEGFSFDRARSDIHLLIPATEPNAELCKTLTSALILGYPTPILLNWGKQFDDYTVNHNGSHLGKIEGLYDYLYQLDFSRYNDLILMMDGYDSWFQLRPDVLVNRWRHINREALTRTEARLGRRAVKAESITQDIVFSAEKNCGPTKALWDEVACYAQPPSPLRKDLYGPQTDILDPKILLPMRMRPSFLNSGFVMGTAGAMRQMIAHTRQMIRTSDSHGSDQHILNEVFGEQEYQREVIRERHQGLLTRIAVFVSKFIGTYTPSIIDNHATHKKMERLPNHPLEFGISLDYGLELVQSAVLSEWDGRFFTYNDSEALTQLQWKECQQDPEQLHVPMPPRVKNLPPDIALSRPLPFERAGDSVGSSSGYRGVPEDPGLSWNDVSLYTNQWTTSIPAVIHLNGFKTMRGALWDKLWFWQHSRAILAERLLETHGVAANTSHGESLQWDNVCRQFEAEVLPPAPSTRFGT